MKWLKVLSRQSSRMLFSTKMRANPAAVSLAYDIYDCSSKECDQRAPVIIIHGLFSSKRDWTSISKNYNEMTGRKVIALDSRNHGESEYSSEMSMQLMSYDIEKVLIQLDIPKAIVIGHSLGGKVAMEMALSRPGYVEKLVVVDVNPTALPYHLKHQLQVVNEAMLNLSLSHVKSLEEADHILAETIPDQGYRTLLLNCSSLDHENCVTWSLNLKGILENLEQITKGVHLKGREKYQGEAIFVAGEQSPYLRRQDLPPIKEMFPHAQLEVVAGTGHFLYTQKPKEFLNILHKFLS